jgi:hypothetical protein
MAQKQYEYKIDITVTDSDQTISEIGMTSGGISLTPKKYPTDGPLTGILSLDWISSIKRSANITKGGNYATIEGGTISINATSGFLEYLRDNNIRIIGSRLEIYCHDGTTETKLYDGIMGVPEDGVLLTKLPFESAERIRNVDMSRLILGSNDKYSAFYGNGKHKLARIETDEITTEIPNNGVAAFEVTYESFSSVRIDTLRENYNTGDGTSYIEYLDGLVSDGYELILDCEGNRLAIDSYGINATFTQTYGEEYRLNITFRDGNIADTGANLGGVCTIKAVKRLYYADPFSSFGFVNQKIYSYEDQVYQEQPEYSDTNTFGTNTINVGETDGIGYSRITPLSIDVCTPEFLPSFIGASWEEEENGWYSSVSGSLTSTSVDSGVDWYVTDGDLDTQFKVSASTGSNKFDNLSYFLKISYPAMSTIPDSLLFTGSIQIDGINLEISPNIDSIDLEVHLDYKYGNTGETSFEPHNGMNDAQAHSDGFLLYNIYPLLLNAPSGTAGTQSFRWDTVKTDTPSHNGFSIDLTEALTGAEYELSAGFDVYVQVFFNGNPAVDFDSASIVFSDISVVAEYTSNLDEIYVDWSGRKDIDAGGISDTVDVFTSAVQLQNLENLGFNGSFTPAEEEAWLGWGQQYPTLPLGDTWSDYIYNSYAYGGVLRTGNAKTVSYELKDKAYTSDVKRDMCRIMCCLGATNLNGVENLYHMVDGLYNTNGVLLDFSQLVGATRSPVTPKITKYKWTDIYPELTVTYSYDTGRDGNTKTISIQRVDKSFIDITDGGSVQGVTETQRAKELWQMGRKLYYAYGGFKNEFPSSLRDYGWLTDEEDVLDSIEDFYRWQGIYIDTYNGTNIFSVRERYKMSVTLDIDYVVSNSLDLGSKIRLDSPFKSNYHSGLITKVDYNITDNTASVSI